MNDIFVTYTFDDGNISQYVDLYPILDEYGQRTTFYITASQIGLSGKMNADNIEDLRKTGNEIGSHTYSHRALTELSDRILDLELKSSKEILHASTFAYPFGRFDKRVVERVKEYYVAARAYTTPFCESNMGAMKRYALKSIDLDSLLTLPSHEFESIVNKTFCEKAIADIANIVQSGYWIIFTMHGRLDFSFDMWLWHIRKKGLRKTAELLPKILNNSNIENDVCSIRALSNLRYLASVVDAGSYIVKPLADVVRVVYE